MADRLLINLTPDIDAPQILTLRLDGRSVAGVSGTVGSVPASLRRLLCERPDLVDSDVELTTLLERPLACVVQPQASTEDSPNRFRTALFPASYTDPNATPRARPDTQVNPRGKAVGYSPSGATGDGRVEQRGTQGQRSGQRDRQRPGQR